MQKYRLYIAGILLAAFALLTLYLSGSILFDLFGMRAKQGDYVMFVIWVNFIAGLLYLLASYGFFAEKIWTSKILILAILILITGGIGLYIHINSGGVYMPKTIKAIAFRMGVTLIFLGISYKKTVNNNI